MATVHLGDEVKDTITNFEGIVTSITEYINGCRRAAVQPRINKDGAIPDAYVIDELQLEVTKACGVPVGRKTTGGPMSKSPSQKAIR